MAGIATNVLDHIVHLIPPGTLEHASDVFRKLGFNVLPGGVHSGGFTANSLVVFADGAYFEILSFTEPISHYPPGSPERQKRETHRWANVMPGWIDYAFLGNGSREKPISVAINDRADKEGTNVRYLEEVQGGRTRSDGVKVEWLITAPQKVETMGLLPFFCGDVTPRDIRVPVNPASNTRHPSGAMGIAFVRILADAASLPRVSNELTTVVGYEPQRTSEICCVWELQSANAKTVELRLSAPTDDVEMQFVGKGAVRIFEIGVVADRKGTVETPYGRLTWVPLPV